MLLNYKMGWRYFINGICRNTLESKGLSDILHLYNIVVHPLVTNLKDYEIKSSGSLMEYLYRRYHSDAS